MAADATVTFATISALSAVPVAAAASLLYAAALLVSALADASAAAAFSAAAEASGESPGGLFSLSLSDLAVDVTWPALQYRPKTVTRKAQKIKETCLHGGCLTETEMANLQKRRARLKTQLHAWTVDVLLTGISQSQQGGLGTIGLQK